ncbi:MAG: hypothetical protein J6K03_00550 [Oscillospiraceae bacterium]|nr:hypothetical protein [Oscillospiraceae bacterium]
MSNIYPSISEKFTALNIDIFRHEDIARCYALAKLNIEHSRKSDYTDGIHTAEFAAETSRYQLLSPDENHYYDSPAFFSLCSELVLTGMDKDCRLFFETFAPFLVADWDKLVTEFPKGNYEKLAYVIHLILRSPKESQLPIAEIEDATIESFYKESEELYHSFGLTKDNFIPCWKAVYHISMPALKGTVSSQLAKTIRFYRQHKVSGLRLLANYCQFNKYRTQLGDPINPWLEFQYTIKGKQNATHGISITETAFDLVDNIKNERPSDVIRAALYPFPKLFGKRSDFNVRSKYDGKFECSFFLRQFEVLARNVSQILIVNPGPDFLLAWSQKARKYGCKCCVAVPNIYVASAYRMEFKNLQFSIFSDIANYAKRFDLIAIVSPFTEEEFNIGAMLSAGTDNANFIALLPQTFISASKDNICTLLRDHGFLPSKIIAIASDATVTQPRKKMLLFAGRSVDPNAPVPVFFTQCDESASNLIVEKEYIHVSQQQLKKPTTLVKLRKDFEKAKIDLDAVKHRKRPSVYQFSNEISLYYTVHRDRYGVYVGEAYYRGKSTPENTKDRQVRNSPATQKGLRCKDRESVIGKLESVPFLDSIYPYIVGNMLDHYGDRLVDCSLKTIWFCCRSRLLARRDYRDEIARNILFCPGGNALSALCPSDASDEDYRNAMQAIIPEDSVAIVKYWQQLNIIMRVAEESGFIHTNPIPALLPEISNRASKELRNLRNMLTKKTFTFEEEARILSYVREESDADFGPRKALLFEDDSTLLLGPIHLFTGMSTREACALTWDDFEAIPGLKAYRLLVYKFLSDEGAVIYHSDGTACRKVPVAPLLADMLNSRKTYLQAMCGFTEAELRYLPIIMPNNKKTLAALSKPSFCKYDAAIRVCRSLIEKANIPTQELVLPGEGDKEIVVDMNKYQGDIFYSNFKHRANHTCSFNRGELSYVVGNKAPDTFSQHYCDYTNDLVQYGMVQKLNRWSYAHETGVQNAVQSTSEASTFTRSTTVHSDRKKNHYNAVSITVSPTKELPGSYIDVLVECDHGVTGSIAVYGTGKEDGRL